MNWARQIFRPIFSQIKASKIRLNFDHLGMGISGLCLIHCLCFPLLILFLPALGTLWEDKTHFFLFFLVTASGLMAFIPGYRLHGQLRPILLAVMGFISLGFATFLAHSWLGHGWEPPLAILGSCSLIIAHCLNHRAKHQCHKCNHHASGDTWDVCWSESEEEYLLKQWQVIFTGSELQARQEFECQKLCIQKTQCVCLRRNYQIVVLSIGPDVKVKKL